jgi:O-antigen ligase
MNGAARAHLVPDLNTSAVITAAAATAAALGAVAVYSPKYAIFALLAGAFLVVAATRLPLAIALFMVLSFPEHLPGTLGAGATLAKPVGALIVIAWAGSLLTRRGALPLLPREQPLLFSAIVGLLAFGAVSTIWAADSGQTRFTLERLVQVAALLLVTYTAASSHRGFRTLIYGYLLASVVTALYTTLSGTYVAKGRLGGVIDPDYFAAELVPAIVIATFLFTTTASRRTRWLSVAVAAGDLVAFVLTQSRGAIVGLMIGLVAAITFAGRARPRIMALVLVLIAGGLGYYLGYKPSHVFQSGARGGLSATSSGRLDEWRVALRIFEGHPVGGVGLGNYQTVEPAYATQTINLSFVGYIVNYRLVAHNTYLQIAAELGGVGLGLFLAILAIPLRLARRALSWFERERNEIEFLARGLLAGTIGMLVAYVFLSAEVEKALWFLLALLAAAPALLRSREAEIDLLEITGPP